ncbi:MAG: metal ABC transporter substrate-binding protein [Pseudomonadota bacterium]
MKRYQPIFLTVLLILLMAGGRSAAADKKLNVVTTIATYGNIAKLIGGDKIDVTIFVDGNEDPHFIRPKLSYSEKLAKADMFVDTGLDLELWVPALEDAAGNMKIMSGGSGYVSASSGLKLLEKVDVQDRKEGDVHIHGNPHIYNCPVCLFQVAKNICTGLKKVDPANKSYYKSNLAKFETRLGNKLYGEALVGILGVKVLNKLAAKGKLISFLEEEQFEGKPLIDSLAGWMKQALPIRGRKVVAYHKNWAYFAKVFGLDIVEYVEPKPGIPPTAKHVKHVVDTMKKNNVKVVLSANYYDKAKVKAVAKKVGAKPVIVTISAGGEKGVDDVFDVFDNILNRLVPALTGGQ